VENVIAAIKNGTLKVFDTAKFTVEGAHITTYTNAWGMNGAQCLKTENGVTYFDESTLRSAPYFDIRIDGITEVNTNN
jgi:basic membrane protein A